MSFRGPPRVSSSMGVKPCRRAEAFTVGPGRSIRLTQTNSQASTRPLPMSEPLLLSISRWGFSHLTILQSTGRELCFCLKSHSVLVAFQGSRSLPGLSAATLASLGGTSSRRGSGDTSISVDTEASIREIKVRLPTYL